MKHYLFAGAVALISATVGISGAMGDSHKDKGKNKRTIEGSGEMVTELRDVDSFSKIMIKGAADMTLRAGQDQRVEISTDPAVMDILSTKVDGDTLVIKLEERVRLRDVDIEIAIDVAQLNAMTIDGALDGDLSGIDSEALDITINGAADLDISGTCGSFDLEINGAGDVSADDLECKEVEVTVNGAGDADVYASEKAVIAINGVGDVDVAGSPKEVKRRSAGLGSISIN